MVVRALHDEGGIDYLRWIARKQPAAFVSLVNKILPTTLASDPSAPFKGSLEVRFVAPAPGLQAEPLAIEGEASEVIEPPKPSRSGLF